MKGLKYLIDKYLMIFRKITYEIKNGKDFMTLQIVHLCSNTKSLELDSLNKEHAIVCVEKLLSIEN